MKKILNFFLIFCFCACSFENDQNAGKIGNKAIELLAKNTRGENVKLHDIKEKVKILVFFQNGCSSCLKELPKFDEFIDKNPSQIGVVAINSVDNAELITVLEKQFNFKHIQILQDDLSITAQKYGVFASPTTIIIKDNIIKERILGEKSWEFIKSKFIYLL